MSVHVQNTRMTTTRLRQMKQNGEKIAMLTSYDFTLTSLLDEAGIDMILVGDSASNVVCGNAYTLPITVDEMIFLARGVVRAAKHCLVVLDMPFGSYQVSEEDAIRNALRMMKESGADALKLEGGEEILPAIRHMVQAGVPVMGHLGLTPQSINKFGTYAVRAREEAEAAKLKADAKLLEEIGCFALVLEKIPATLAKEVSESLNIPVIGIGAGQHTDGQVLVAHDMLGITQAFSPRFLRRYANLQETIIQATQEYIKDVKSRNFPNEKEQY